MMSWWLALSDRLDLDFGHDDIDHGTSDDYYTPPTIFTSLGLSYDMDVSAPPNGVPWIPAKRFLSVIDDGLATPWEGRVWCNPPYSDVTPWANKFIAHGNGIALVQVSKARWFDTLWVKGDGFLILPSNLKFMTPSGETKGIFMPCVLVGMGEENVEAMRRSNLGHVR